MEKTVSVIVTCYNHANYIETCLRSIFEQTYPHIALWVFNDGSTDRSEEVIKTTLETSPYAQTNYIYHDNQGLVKTRNLALDMIETPYVLFVDSDNALEANYIEALLQVSETQYADIVYTNLKDFDTQAVLVSARAFDLQQFYVENYIDSCSLIRRNAIADVRYDINLNHQKLEDYDFFMNLIVNHGAKAAPCQNTHLNYRVLEHSLSARDDLGYYYDIYAYILGKYFGKHPVLAQKALRINFRRLYDLMGDRILDDRISIYYDYGEGFSEAVKDTFALSSSGRLEITVPKMAERIRVDLGELAHCYETVTLRDVLAQCEVSPSWTNGVKDGSSYLFTDNDPQIIFELALTADSSFVLDYKLYNTRQSGATDYIGRVMAQRITALKDQYRLEKERLATLEQAYHKVIGSRRWIITTKIINFFRRKP